MCDHHAVDDSDGSTRWSKELLLASLQKRKWNQTRAAAFLKITRSTLLYRMQKFGLERPKSADEALDESNPPIDAV